MILLELLKLQHIQTMLVVMLIIFFALCTEKIIAYKTNNFKLKKEMIFNILLKVAFLIVTMMTIFYTLDYKIIFIVFGVLFSLFLEIPLYRAKVIKTNETEIESSIWLYLVFKSLSLVCFLLFYFISIKFSLWAILLSTLAAFAAKYNCIIANKDRFNNKSPIDFIMICFLQINVFLSSYLITAPFFNLTSLVFWGISAAIGGLNFVCNIELLLPDYKPENSYEFKKGIKACVLEYALLLAFCILPLIY